MPKFTDLPRRVLSHLWSRLPWHGKLAMFFAVLAILIYTLGFVGSILGALLGIPI